MNEQEKPSNKAWVEHWQHVGPLLKQIQQDELSRFDYQEHREVIDALFDLAVRFGTPRKTSGLVELQRLLQKGRQ